MMADKPFRVLFDVTNLHLEDFNYVWINVSPRELRTIYDLKKYVLRRINLEQNVQLFLGNGLLLDEETTVILREDDIVKIKYKSTVCQNLEKESLKECVNFSRKRSHDASNISDVDTNSKRYKPEVANSSSNITVAQKTSKKKKNKQSESPINLESFVCTSVEKIKKKLERSANSENSNCTSLEKRKKQTESSINVGNYHSTLVEENQSRKKSNKDKKKSSTRCDQIVTDIDFCKTNDSFNFLSAEYTPQEQNKNNKPSKIVLSESEKTPGIFNNVSASSKEDELCFDQNKSSEDVITDVNSLESSRKNQSKRKRKRVRKRKKQEIHTMDNCDPIHNLESISENIGKSTNRKHILYLSPDQNKKICNLNGVGEIHNHSTDKFVLEEDTLTDIPSQDCPIMSTPVQTNNCNVPDLQLSIVPNESSNLLSNDNGFILNGKSATKNAFPSNKENESKKQSYEDLPGITDLPAVGTRIAYKVLELGENYSPVLTDYREGVIERIIPDTDEVEIRLTKKVILPAKSGKFENLGKDEVPEPIIKACDALKWSEIISPKLLSCLPD